MADVKKIKIGGTWYNVKDETARNGLAAKQDTLTFDTTPTANSTNPVTSGGVNAALDGKVSKSGGTITGDLTINNGKLFSLIPSDTTKMGRAIISIRNNEQLIFWHRNTDCTYQDLYLLPPISSEFSTKNNYYDILTSKNPVTVAQGGTGGTDSGVKSLSNSSVYTGMIRYRKIGVFVYLYLDGVQVKTDISASTIRDLATLPEGYRPTHPSSASLFGFAGNAGNPGIISITTSGVISFTPMSAWSVNAILRGSIMYCI